MREKSPFLAWGDFHARLRFARSTIPEEKWGTTRSLNIHRPDNDCPCAKKPDIGTQTYTYAACPRLRDSGFGEIENKARTRKYNGRKLGRARPPPPSFSQITCLYFRVPHTHASSLLSESLEQAKTHGAKTDPPRVK